MTDRQLNKLTALIAEGNTDSFYLWPAWKALRERVLKADNYECQICKGKGKYKRAEIVHHIKHVKDRPDLALSMFDGDNRQLISVCKQCHEDVHPESFRRYDNIKPPVTAERWD